MKCEHYCVTAVDEKDKRCTNLWRCGAICNNGEQKEGTKNCYQMADYFKKKDEDRVLHNKLVELNAMRPDCTLCENMGLHGCSDSYCVWFSPKLKSQYKEINDEV